MDGGAFPLGALSAELAPFTVSMLGAAGRA